MLFSSVGRPSKYNIIGIRGESKGFLNTKSPNDVVEVSFIRDGKLKTLNVKLEKLTTIYIPILGTLRELNSTELKKLGSDYGLELQDLSDYYKEEFSSIVLSRKEKALSKDTELAESLLNDIDNILPSFENIKAHIFELSINVFNTKILLVKR